MSTGYMRRKTATLIVGGICGFVAPLGAGGTAAAAPTGTIVPLTQQFRECDFAQSSGPAIEGHGTGRAEISRSAANTVTAQVHLLAAEPGTLFTVRLIQAPRSAATCGPGEPGVTAAQMGTDGVGSANATLTAPIANSATGVWVMIDRPAGHAQTPVECYASDFVVPL